MARSRMHVESKSCIGLNPSVAQTAADSKKELKQEIADIRGFTLMFENDNMEMKWNLMHIERHIGITTRYLFAASVFQGLFYWSDCLESHGDSTYLFQLGCLRLLLGGFTLLGCFLVSTGLIVPTQMAVFWINMFYGFPSLAIFYLARPNASVFDSLYLVYGLCFFILPKISPLNFIFGFSGALLYTFLFIYISAFRLSLQQWLLSNTFLMIIVSLFCYISYSAERVSRERWLLRERLKRERINLRIVASSIQDDLTRAANDERNYPLDVMNQHNFRYDNTGKSIRLLASMGGGASNADVVQNEQNKNNSDKNEISSIRGSNIDKHGYYKNESPGMKKQKRVALFFRSLSGWALCYGMGYAFDFVSQPESAFPREINSSPAFALLMHSMGFSVFLMLFTGQIRWLAMNGVVGLALMWVFNRSGMDNRWVVFSTHSVGYILLALVIIIMILVFGGVVLVWTHLIDFLKEIILKYPEVKEEISENKVLEQVLIRYISDMPKTKFLSRSDKESSPHDSSNEEISPHVLQVYKDYDSDEEDSMKNPHVQQLQQHQHHQHSMALVNYPLSSKEAQSSMHKGNDSSQKYIGKYKSTCENHTEIISSSSNVVNYSDCSENTNSQDQDQCQHQTPSLSSLASAIGTNKSNKNKNQQSHKIMKKNISAPHSDVPKPCERDCKQSLMRVISAKRLNCCFFCLKADPQVLVPACAGWMPQISHNDPVTAGHGLDGVQGQGTKESKDDLHASIPMCTPYTEMIHARDAALSIAELDRVDKAKMKTKYDLSEQEKILACSAMSKMQKKLGDMEGAMMRLVKSCESQIVAEKKQRDMDVQSIIAQHNHQLAELKRLHKALAVKQLASVTSAAAATAATAAANDVIAASLSQSPASASKSILERNSPSTSISTTTATSVLSTHHSASNVTATLASAAALPTSIMLKSPLPAPKPLPTNENSANANAHAHAHANIIQNFSHPQLARPVTSLKTVHPLNSSPQLPSTSLPTHITPSDRHEISEPKLNHDKEEYQNQNLHQRQSQHQEEVKRLKNLQNIENSIPRAHIQSAHSSEGLSYPLSRRHLPRILDPRSLNSADGEEIANRKMGDGDGDEVHCHEQSQSSREMDSFFYDQNAFYSNKNIPSHGDSLIVSANSSGDRNGRKERPMFESEIQRVNIFNSEYYINDDSSQNQNQYYNRIGSNDVNYHSYFNDAITEINEKIAPSETIFIGNYQRQEDVFNRSNHVESTYPTPRTFWEIPDDDSCSTHRIDSAYNETYSYPDNKFNYDNFSTTSHSNNQQEKSSDFLLSISGKYQDKIHMEKFHVEAQDFHQPVYQLEELDINDAESRFWLPSLDFDEIQQLLHQELSYPVIGGTGGRSGNGSITEVVSKTNTS